MKVWLAVGVGGALGSMARHGVNIIFARHFTLPVPLATGVVNLAGCLIIGVLTGLIVGGHIRMNLPTRAFAMVGVLGGFTTFSTFGLDTFTLLKDGQPVIAAANVLAQVIGGLFGVWLGYVMAK